MSKEPWTDYRADPLTEEELQILRYFMSETTRKMELIWFLWGWMATAIRDRKSWVAFGVVAAILFRERLMELVQAIPGGAP